MLFNLQNNHIVCYNIIMLQKCVLVAQLCPTLCDPMDCNLPGFSVHSMFQARKTGVGYHFLLQGIFIWKIETDTDIQNKFMDTKGRKGVWDKLELTYIHYPDYVKNR